MKVPNARIPADKADAVNIRDLSVDTSKYLPLKLTVSTTLGVHTFLYEVTESIGIFSVKIKIAPNYRTYINP